MKISQKIALWITIGPLVLIMLYLNWKRIVSSSLSETLTGMGIAVGFTIWSVVLFYGLTGGFPVRWWRLDANQDAERAGTAGEQFESDGDRNR